MPRSLLLALAAALSLALAACGPKPQQFTATGVIGGGNQDDQGHIWFELQRVDQRFTIDASNHAQLFEVLKDSAHTGRSITLQYDGDSGYFEPDGTKPIYVARTLIYRGKTLGAEPFGPFDGIRWFWQVPLDTAEPLLARAIGLAQQGDSAGAHRILAPLIEGRALRPALQAVALKTDGHALYGEALDRPSGAGRDKLLLAALDEYRAWQELAPDDSDAALSIASALTELGAYDEAIAALRKIAATWPEERFWAFIHLGAVYRTLGDYKNALAALDALKGDEATGMAYYYHRGWTLSAFGRYSEADAAFTKGLENQPDFAWAFVRRACARAALGRIREAADDQAKAVAQTDSDAALNPDARASANYRHDRARMMAVRDMLRAAAAKGSPDKIDGLCEGYTDYGEAKRARSSLLIQG